MKYNIYNKLPRNHRRGSEGVSAYVSKGSMTAIHAAHHRTEHKVFKQYLSESPTELLKRLYAKEQKTNSNTDAESTDTPVHVLLTSERFEELLVKSMRIHAEKIATRTVVQIKNDAAEGSLHLAVPYHLASFDSHDTAHQMKSILSEFLPADQLTVTYLNSSHSIDMVVRT